MDKKGLCLLLNVFVAEDAECIAEVAEQFFCDGLGGGFHQTIRMV